jgi:Ca2+-binding RTX toxin-like protein
LDGTYLVPFTSIITDVAHHLDLLAGNDKLFGGAGDDKLVGDNAVVFSPSVTINQTYLESAFRMTWDLHSAFDDLGDLILRLHHTVGDAGDYHPWYSQQNVIVDRTFYLGNDELDGGTGDDFMVGDDITVMSPSFAVPWTMVNGLNKLVYDIDEAGDAADWALHELDDVAHDLRDVVISMKFGRRIQYQLIHHIDRIFVGKDSLIGGEGDDVLVGDHWGYLAPEITVTSGGWTGYHHGWHRNSWYHHSRGSYGVWNHGQDNHCGWYGSSHQHQNHYDGLEDEWIIGNDSMNGGTGNDVMFGDSIVLTEPTMASAPDVSWWKFRSVRHEVEDILEDIVMIGQHGNFDDCHAVSGGSDCMVGGAGDDILFGQGGNDKLYGDADNDLLVGGYGKDALVGGPGKDKLIQGVSSYEDSKGRNHKGSHESKIDPCASWVKHFISDLAVTDNIYNPNSGIEVMLPCGGDSKPNMSKGCKK